MAIAGRFVEFFGPGVSQLSAPDRITIANMCPEYNATVSYFPVDQVTLKHFKKTSESPQRCLFFIIIISNCPLITNHFTFPDFSQEKLDLLESYLKAVKLFRSYEDPTEDPQYSEVSTLTTAVVLLKLGFSFLVKGNENGSCLSR